ncbi:MAG: carbamoyltransferase HypF [Methyloprofundus sp.]|nr:carbamoyltransferase HypF [Methyloprofundus sp.]
MLGKAIYIRGTVQGVGFRPYIWHLAQQYQLCGSVWNDAQGVSIHAWGSSDQLNNFIKQIPQQLPPLANIIELSTTELSDSPTNSQFTIVSSQQDNAATTSITADAATCKACLTEINDPHNRRYRYPFTNCTHCGPRLSIIKAIPYDRCRTSMAEFTMCSACQAEYHDPSNRRFHTQANCCTACGPQVWLEDVQLKKTQSTDAIQKTAQLLQQGYIIAIKGLGGWHLACDASNEIAVARLRQAKQRPAKPFALMAQNIDMIKEYAYVDTLEQQALSDSRAAIVILQAIAKPLAPSVAPAETKLGFMLPYTPLHSLLLQDCHNPLVMTSGNISAEPQCISNQDARDKLTGIADYFLVHNRDIVNRLDDSVIRKLDSNLHVLRRARGFSPEVLALPEGFQSPAQILAMGGELKNSLCLLKDGMAMVSQHIGDLENASTQQDYRHQLQRYQQLYHFKADLIAIDLHPNYLSSQYGQQLAESQELPLVKVQHHHAHVAACMIEHGLPLDPEPVLAAAFDGLGMGEQGELWGGEFLLSNYTTCRRLAHFQPIAMPGGTQAVLEPWRNLYAQLAFYFDYQAISEQFAELDIMQLLASKPLATLDIMIAKNLNSPISSSCGRWFDACAAILGLCPEKISYEGQAAISLENLATTEFNNVRHNHYGYTLVQYNGYMLINWQVFWQELLQDLHTKCNKAVIAARIHHTLIAASAELLLLLSAQTKTSTIILTGGVFQNKLLLQGLTEQLQQQGKKVLSPCKYPMNDGGLALGQAVIAAGQFLRKPHEQK